MSAAEPNRGGPEGGDGPHGNGGREAIRPLGHEVYQIDTRMAGYGSITAAYLIRTGRPCLVETGTAPSAGVVPPRWARWGGALTTSRRWW